MIPVEFNSITLPDYDIKEILRYAKTKSAEGLPLDECLNDLRNIEGKVAFAEFNIENLSENLDLGFAKTVSKDLHKALGNSEKILVFAATIGLEPDRLAAKYARISPAKSVLIQAIATERIEALCDEFCNRRKAFYEAQGCCMKPRFSPGYGDLSLELQRQLLPALDCQRLLGISLSESLLMMPSKSVTAIAGIYRK